MKQLLLLIFISACFSQTQLQSQICTPDETYRDSAVGVYPPPRNANNPDGGINESACINKPYEFTFTFKVPRMLDVNGVIVTIDSIVLEKDEPTTIVGLPEGMDWSCNPGDCVFDPFIDSLGCALIYGVPSSNNPTGDYPLTITTKIYNNVFQPFLQLTFPNTIISGADGDYTLVLEDENSTNCFIVGADEPWKAHFRLASEPNPFSYYTNITVIADYKERFDFKVFDMMGRQLHQQSVQLFEGKNSIPFDGSQLENGLYLYSLSNENGAISQRIVVQR